ncbi:MAG: hypothetical protein ACOCY1_06090 [Halovenus sp.]
MSSQPAVSELIGTTIKSPDLLWYEVHDAEADGEVRIVGIDDLTDTTIALDELADRMSNGWGKVYDGVTGEPNPKVGWP